jgi:hypothetical protein
MPASLKSILKSRSMLLANCYLCHPLTFVNLDFAKEYDKNYTEKWLDAEADIKLQMSPTVQDFKLMFSSQKLHASKCHIDIY